MFEFELALGGGFEFEFILEVDSEFKNGFETHTKPSHLAVVRGLNLLCGLVKPNPHNKELSAWHFMKNTQQA